MKLTEARLKQLIEEVVENSLFMSKYKSLTDPAESSLNFKVGEILRAPGVEDTFSSLYRVWKFPENCEVITLIKPEDEYIYLSLILASRNCKGKGLASQVMYKLTDLSDSSGKDIVLHVAYSSDNYEAGEKLLSWYESFGFEYNEEFYKSSGYDIIYSPTIQRNDSP